MSQQADLLSFIVNEYNFITTTIALVGLIVACIGIIISVIELRQQNRVLEASNAYEIQRDARALFQESFHTAEFEAVLNGEETVNEQFIKFVWLAVNFYASVYRQQRSGGLSKRFVDEYKAEYREFLSREPVKQSWNKLKTGERLSELHLEMHNEWCP